jgi:hypothetical protein
MKAIWLTRHRRGGATSGSGAPRVSLFPFLAVLICTMGALMLLLLLVTHEARQQAARIAAARDAERQSSIASELETVQWRVDQLKKSRLETEAQLTDARLVLGHIEDHLLRLRNQFRELSQQARQAADQGLASDRFAAAGEEELRQIEGKIELARRQLDLARRKADGRPKSYAIVPYEGPNHTRRRPIYIECRGDAVVLQPENIVFNEADFDEPLGPGNPLAAAIRAAREQMIRQGSRDPQDAGEPYPLLLVRPAGILAYECALAAMQSWGSEFGYELINDDWQLKYPPPDPNLAKAVQQAIDLARQEHARLIAAAPSKYGKRPRSGSFRAAAAVDAAEQGGESESPGFYSSKPADRYAKNGGGPATSGRGNGNDAAVAGTGRGGSGRFGAGGGNDGIGGGGGESSGPAGDAEFAANNPYAGLPAPGTGGLPGMGPGGQGTAPGYGAGNGMAGGPGSGFAPGMAGSPGMGPGGQGTAPGYSAGNPGAPGAGGPGSGFVPGMAGFPSTGPGAGSGYGPGVGMGNAPGSAVVGNLAGAQNASAQSFLNSGGGGPNNYGPSGNQGVIQPGGQISGGSLAVPGVTRPDGYITGRPNDGNPLPQPPPTSNTGLAPAAPLRPGEWRDPTVPPKPDPEAEAKEKKKHPYDKVKIDHDQNDWALRNSTRHAAAISRSIQVDCYPDRIVLKSEADGEPRVVFCDSGRGDADKLVAAVWEIMDTWGMAGREMYWRPVLNFYVVPGAEARLSALSRSLEGSGLVIERKQ